MRRLIRLIPLVLVFGFVGAPAVSAQMAKQEMKPPTATVSLYRIVPGKQLEFLKWVAENESIAKEAGAPASQIYSHTNGDSWDYMQVTPTLSEAQEAKVDEISKKRGRKTGFAAGLEFRALVAWHTDTQVVGPVSAADLIASASK